MGRRWPAVLVAVGLVVGGTLVGVTGPARAASLGAVTLSQQSGNVSDTPIFATATTVVPCPSGYGENTALRVGRPGGPYSNLGPANGGGGFDTAPVSMAANRSFTTALGGTVPGAGEWWVIVECYSLTLGRHADEFRTTVTVCGTTWRVGTTCSTATPTTTALAVDPAGPVEVGTAVTLTATVTPAAAAGKVVFRRTTPPVSGEPVTVELGTVDVAAGTATLRVPDLPGPENAPQVTHTLRASFVPTDGNAFLESTALPKEITVFPVGAATPTTTALAVSPPGPLPSGGALTLTATLTPAAAAGSVRFERRDSGVAGNPWAPIASVPVAAGTATHTGTLPDGLYDVQAVFVPADSTKFAQSTSDVTAAYRIGQATGGPVATTTSLTVSPPGPQREGIELTLTAIVQPSGAAGRVVFLDGSSELGSRDLADGTASFSTSTLPVGNHDLKATFTPTDTAAYRASASAVTAYEISSADDPGGGDDPGDDDPGGGGGAGDDGKLAKTGAPLVTIAGAGVFLTVAGAGLLVLVRRRRDTLPVEWPDRTGSAA